MIRSSAHVPTERAGQYLEALTHRTRIVSTGPQRRAVILFPIGKCELIATENCLHLEITASSLYEATLMEDAISERLDGLAADERLRYQWIFSPERWPAPRPSDEIRKWRVIR